MRKLTTAALAILIISTTAYAYYGTSGGWGGGSGFGSPTKFGSYANGVTEYFLQLIGARDAVTGNDNADTSAGPIQYLTDTDKLITVASATPLVIDNSIVGYGAWSQYLASPSTPANQTTGALPTGEHTLWIRGTGSVALSANTATITGAGSATEGDPLTIDVTGAGTVDIVKTGDVEVFQLHTGGYSIEPLFLNLVGSVASRAGTQSLENISSDYPRVLDALRGGVNGIDRVVNGDFSTGDLTGWIIASGTASVVSGRARLGDPTAITRVRQNIPVDNNSTYLVSFDVVGTNDNSHFVHLGTFAGGTNYINNLSKGEPSGTFTYIVDTVSTNLWIELGSIDPELNDYDNVSAKKVSAATARITATFKSGVSADDLADGNYNIFSLDGNLIDYMYWSKSGATRKLNIFDGTNTASVDFDFSANIDYDIGGVWGYHIASAANKMQVSAAGSASALSDFAGRFPITGDNLVFGFSNNELLYLKDIIILPPPSGEGWGYDPGAVIFELPNYLDNETRMAA